MTTTTAQGTLVRILGDRQQGKTELLLAAAASWMRQGRYVAFVARDWRMAQECFLRFLEHIQPGDPVRACRTNGNLHVRETVGDGRVHFVADRAATRYSGAEIVILDDLDRHAEMAVFDFPNAHIYRTVL